MQKVVENIWKAVEKGRKLQSNVESCRERQKVAEKAKKLQIKLESCREIWKAVEKGRKL